VDKIDRFIAVCESCNISDNMEVVEEGLLKNWIEKHKNNKNANKQAKANAKQVDALAKGDYEQACVIHGLICETKEDQEKIINYLLEKYDIHAKFGDCVVTNGSKERKEEGGRHDVIFLVNSKDIDKVSAIKCYLGIRWWEDVVSYNNNAYLYSKEILNKYPVRW